MFTKKQKNESPKKLFESSVLAIFPLFSTFSSTILNAHLSNIKIFQSFYKDPNFWRNLYQAHFGKLIFHEDYKEQYIANYLFHETEDYMFHAQGVKLKEHILQQANKKWALFYKAYLIKEEYIKNQDFVDAGFAALEAGEPRSAHLLIKHYQTRLMLDEKVSQNKLDRLLKLLSCHHGPECEKLRCMTYCLISTNTIDVGEKDKYETMALKLFYNLLSADDKDIRSFIGLFIDVFRTLKIINYKDCCWIHDNEELLKSNNVRDAMQFWINKRNPALDQKYLIEWFINEDELSRKIHSRKQGEENLSDNQMTTPPMPNEQKNGELTTPSRTM